MRFACPIVLLFTSLAFSQTANLAKVQPPAPLPKAKNQLPSAASLPPSAPVIVIAGLCDLAPSPSSAHPAAAKAEAKPCKTVITRAEFDTLADAIEPKMSPEAKAQLASVYPKLLLMQREFRKRGLANDPLVQRALAFASLRSKAEEMAKTLKMDAAGVTPPEADVMQYYSQNSSSFEQIELQRIYIPDERTSSTARQAAREAASPVAAPAPAPEPYQPPLDALQARAAHGEDFDALQAEVFKLAGMTGTPPKSNIGYFAVAEIPENLRPVLALKNGEVSPVLSGPNGSYIYKMVSRAPRPLEEVRGEIREKLADSLFAKSMLGIENSAKVQLNPVYFPTSAAGKGRAGGKGSHGTIRSNMPPKVTPSTGR
jgi:PPIC-type PPIASE domain